MSDKHLNSDSKFPPRPAKGKLRLYSNRFCPYSQRVRLVLDAKKIPYDIVNINLANKPAWIYDKSLKGKIPALEIENEVICESLIIADFIDEKYPKNKLNPDSPLQKAKDRMLLEEFTKGVQSTFKILMNPRRSYIDEVDLTFQVLDFLENELRKRDLLYFCGDNPGMLDYMIWPWCERADSLKLIGQKYTLNKSNYKKLVSWRDRMLENPVVKKSYIDSKTHMEFLKSYKAGYPDYDLVI